MTYVLPVEALVNGSSDPYRLIKEWIKWSISSLRADQGINTHSEQRRPSDSREAGLHMVLQTSANQAIEKTPIKWSKFSQIKTLDLAWPHLQTILQETCECLALVRWCTTSTKNGRSVLTPIPGFVLQPLSHVITIITSRGCTPPDYSASSWAAYSWPSLVPSPPCSVFVAFRTASNKSWVQRPGDEATADRMCHYHKQQRSRTARLHSASSRAACSWWHVSLNKQPLEHYNLIGAANFLKFGIDVKPDFLFSGGRALPD